MTLYTSFQIVDSPLSEELEPFIRIRKQDLPMDPVQQRMLFILGVVLLLVTTFTLFVVPGRIAAVGEAARAAVVNEVAKVENVEQAGLAKNLALAPVFSDQVQHWRPQILAWSRTYDLDPNIVATIMQIESCGDPKAMSSAGARGLFQVMPFHFTEGEDMFDPETNAHRGLSYYQEQLQFTDGDIFLSFAGYNGGTAASSSSWDAWANETQRYFIWSKGIYEDANSGLQQSPTLDRWMAAGGTSLCQQASMRLGLQ